MVIIIPFGFFYPDFPHLNSISLLRFSIFFCLASCMPGFLQDLLLGFLLAEDLPSLIVVFNESCWFSSSGKPFGLLLCFSELLLLCSFCWETENPSAYPYISHHPLKYSLPSPLDPFHLLH